MEGYETKPVDKSNWSDLELLFESRGGPHPCWCMVWRKMGDRAKATKSHKKEALKDYVKNGLPVGVLAYHENKPVAWCSVAPRDSYRELGGNPELKNVWSIVCFFIKKEFRKKGLKNLLIKDALTYAEEQGAEYIEAYPVDKDSPSFRFMGFMPNFEKRGFKYIKKIGKRRNLMSMSSSNRDNFTTK